MATLRVRHQDAHEFVVNLLKASGVSASHAAIVAQGLVEADLRGVDSHGINRIPSYLARIRAGVLDPKAEPTLTQVTPVVAQVNAHNGFGSPAAHLAMSTACTIASTFGIGLVSVKHSNHFGMSAWLVRQAVDRGMMSLVFTNSSPALPVWGGKSQLMGVSPIACGAPGGNDSRPFILDMAPSVAARGKIHKALRRGEKIPKGWALDAEGRETEDPAEALKGVMLPMGGPKGSALAVMMDVFSGVMSGSAFAGGVVGPYDLKGPGGVGHFIVAIKPDLFVSLEEFRERMGILYKKVVESDRAEGVERIYFPGEIEQLTEEERLKDGIPYVQDEVDALNAEADNLQVPRLKVLA
ncbi:Malate/L-lactate dehydrogenase [Immersiella caudata]|uniref:Malate/L-lactate dehydrogenase n=1 Tax=Immersiella caudata TaxID=314043 RepID=A0AA39WK00_9PEZI|nr:Malate/L-lactate dehydrogenase [Immersiella caudata]